MILAEVQPLAVIVQELIVQVSNSVKNVSAYADQNHAPSLATARLDSKNITKRNPAKVYFPCRISFYISFNIICSLQDSPVLSYIIPELRYIPSVFVYG